MAAAQFLRQTRRGAAFSSACLCFLPLAACAGLGAGAEQPGSRTAPVVEPRAVDTALDVSPDLVPDPSVLRAAGTARWDGRRTLQGVWVAYPQAKGARRVRIYNTATGAAADGALFTRQATLSGPSVLVSSDAATLLGMAPGVETELRIVALSRPAQNGPKAMAQAPGAAPPAPEAAPGAAPAAAPTARASSGERPMAGRPERAVARPAAATPGLAAEPVDPVPPVLAPAPTPPPPSQGAIEAAVAPTAAVAAGPASSPAGLLAVLNGEAEDTTEARASGGGADAAPDDARRDAAAGPAPASGIVSHAEREGSTAAEAPAAARVPTAPTIAAPNVPAAGEALAVGDPIAASTRPPSSLDQPYVQAGIFSVPENAARLIGRLRAAGVPAVGRPAQLATGPATRVLAGPFAAAVERDSARRRIQDMGLRDAVPVAR